MTDPFASIIESARVSHVLQWSLNPANSAREARLECTCGLVFAKTTVESDDAYTSAVRDRLWIEGGTAALAHVKTKAGRN